MFHKRLLKEFKENMKLVVGMVATQWLMLMANVIMIMTIADFIDNMINMAAVDSVTGASLVVRAGINRLAVTLILVIGLRALLSAINSKFSYTASMHVKVRLRELVLKKLMTLGGSYRGVIGTSEAVQISTEGVEQLEIYFGKYVPQFFYSMLAPITLFVIVGRMSMLVAVVLIICVPLIPVSIVAVQKFAKKMLAKYWGTYTELGDTFLESLQGLTTLKLFNADERYAEKMDEESEKFRKVTMRVLIMQLNSISIMDLVAYGGAALGIIVSLFQLRAGNITFAQNFFIIMISAEFFLPLRLLGSFFHIAMNGNAAADKIFKLLDTPETEVKKISDIGMEKMEFKNVSYGYDSNNVLEGVSMKFKRGLTALVGESGCGKSTTVSLIMGNNTGYDGEILIGNSGNVELSDVRLDVLRTKITRISHNSYVFAGTLRSNLLMGNPNATDEQLMEAVNQVNLADFVNENGLDMIITEKAANLSGGQKQRVAIARALLHDSDMYIFDEAASNVDVESENDIMRVIAELSKRKTVLIISHRLANVVDADNIYVLKDGKINASGTHKEIMLQNGYYSEMFNAQMALEHFREVNA